MKSFVCVLIISALALTKAHSDIGKFMEHLGVIPDVINDAPEDYLTVQYANGIKADKGVELKPTQVKDEPTVKWKGEEGVFYTLAMVDPDAPSRADPKRREFNHWLVVNIPDTRVGKGEALYEYVGSGPPKGTGLHRYVFLLYKQPKGTINFTEKKIPKTSAENRPLFSIRKFAEKYNLGKPIAGNFYQAQWDEYVPTVHAQLGLK